MRPNKKLKNHNVQLHSLVRSAWLGTVPAILIVALTPGLSRGASDYSLTPSVYGMQLKTPDGRVVFEYMTKKPADIGLTSPSVACFHPVNTPSGERVTNIAPNDHPHHRGIFLGWQDAEFHEPANLAKYGPTHPLRALSILRGDFWGWGEYAPREGRLIQNRDVKLVGADSEHAALEVHNEWTLTDATMGVTNPRKMLDEVDKVTVVERDGVYVIDLEYRLTPVADYILNRSGFGGFAVQCRKDGEVYFSTATGKVSLPDPHYSFPESNLPAEPWYDFTIQLRDSGKTVGAAVVDHPQNPPSTWHNARYLFMVNPSITGPGQVTIKANTPLTLRYRVVVHDGPTPTALLQKLSGEWRLK